MWKKRLLEFAGQFRHPAWGTDHYERVFRLSLKLAESENQIQQVDADCLLAAACLHDIGAFPSYKQDGVDHAERSAQAAEEMLAGLGFPREKIPRVQEIIRGHMFYAVPGQLIEAVLFHDADTLDFMGAVGMARLLGVVGLDDWTPDLKTAVDLIKEFAEELPDRLYTPSAKHIGRERREEMLTFLAALDRETENCRHLYGKKPTNTRGDLDGRTGTKASPRRG